MGSDRVIDLFFTTGSDNYHIIVELYDRVRALELYSYILLYYIIL